MAACLQSLIIAAAHENDIRLSVSTLRQRHVALLWMIRLQEAGAPVTWLWTLGTFVVLIVALTIIWVAPEIGSRRNAPEWREAVGTGSETPRTRVA